MAIAVVVSTLVERLVLQQKNIRVLLESAPNGFVLVDERGTIKLVNASAEKLYERVASLALEDMSVFAPIWDILAAVHVKADVRLFMN